MMQTLLLAFRNLQRNLRRTVLTCLLLGCSLAALIVVDGIMQGTIKTLVDGATTLLSGHAQVHRRGFLDSYSTDLYISDPAPSITRIESGDAQAAWAQRTISTAMLSSPSGSTPGLVYGVDFTSEAGVSSIGRAVVQGVNLSGQQSELLMGQELAEHLEARLGDRVVVTLSKVDGGGVTQELFRLSGLLHFGVRELDANTAFINLDQAQQIIGIRRQQVPFLKIWIWTANTMPVSLASRACALAMARTSWSPMQTVVTGSPLGKKLLSSSPNRPVTPHRLTRTCCRSFTTFTNQQAPLPGCAIQASTRQALCLRRSTLPWCDARNTSSLRPSCYRTHSHKLTGNWTTSVMM